MTSSRSKLATSDSTLDPRTRPVYSLYRRFRKVLLSAGDTPSLVDLGPRLLEELVGGEPFLTGFLFRRVGDEMRAEASKGRPLPNLVLDAHDLVPRTALERGWLLVERFDSRFDEHLRPLVGDAPAAFLALGREILLVFELAEPLAPDELAYALASLHSLTELALSQRELRGVVEQAQRVQTSLLPSDLPSSDRFELAVRSRPAEFVGGDLYDAFEPHPDTLALAIGDASGHGLPAALQARDAVIGLRMGCEQGVKAVRMMEQLDRVIARSSVAGRFISLFYAELDREGHLIYVNAGHVPPLLVRASTGAIEILDTAGPVIGLGFSRLYPYARAFAHLEPGDLLVLHTDGLTEVYDDSGVELGEQPLHDLVRADRGRSLEYLLDRAFDLADCHQAAGPQPDDQTLLLVRRKA